MKRLTQEVACAVVTSGHDCWVRLSDTQSGALLAVMCSLSFSCCKLPLHAKSEVSRLLLCSAGELFAEGPIVKDKPLIAVSAIRLLQFLAVHAMCTRHLPINLC